MPALNIRRRGYALGAEITGVDALKPLDDATLGAIRQAILDHVVVYLPGQNLGPKEFTRFCESFGETDVFNTRPHNRHAEYPAIYVAASKTRGLGNANAADAKSMTKSSPADRWHSDYAHSERPSTLTFLVARELPEVGGNTMFANLYMAYETLSPGLQKIVDGLHAVHDVRLGAGYASQSPEGQAKDIERCPLVVHPLVRVHPDTGRKLLFVTDRIRTFVGMTEEETNPLLEYLRAHATRYEAVYRHQWTVNDLLIWDNRCSLHLAVQDYDRSKSVRHMLRISLLDPDFRTPLYEPERALATAGV